MNALTSARTCLESAQPVLDPETSRLIRELIEQYCGLTQGLESAFFLQRRLRGRVDALGLTSFAEYYRHLRYSAEGQQELALAVECLTTHETYFFREQYQLDALVAELIPTLMATRKARRTLTLWSAGCSSGEEVYTLAILLREIPELADWKVRILGSDLSRQIVSKARAGIYGLSSFRSTPIELREKYFVPVEQGFRACPELRSMCAFVHNNLVDGRPAGAPGTFDAILCRNVLMYLSARMRQQVVQGFYEALTPGGYLLLGHSESLLQVASPFDYVQLSADLVYRRPAAP